MLVELNKLPYNCDFIHGGKLFSISYQMSNGTPGHLQCHDGFAVRHELPASTMVEPVSVLVRGVPMPYAEYKARFPL